MKNATPPARRRRRAPNGNPRPYRDGNRWIAPGFITLPDGSRRSVRGSGTTQALAIQHLEMRVARAEAERQLMAAELSRGPLFNDCVEEWLESKCANGREYKTVVGYRHAHRRWIEPAFAGLRLAEIDAERLEGLQADVLAGHSPSSWRQVHTVLNHVFKEALRRKRVQFNPVSQLTTSRSAAAAAEHLSLEEARRIMSHAVEAGEQARWLLALSVGMRQGECLGLKWDAVELDGPNPQLYVRSQLQRQTGAGLVLKAPKSKKSVRAIPLNSTLVAALRERRAIQNRERLLAGPLWVESGLVFTTATGAPIDPSNDRKHWLRTLTNAGVRLVKLHAARHTTASLMFADRVPSYTVKQALGHSSIQVTTDIYGHVMPDAVGEAVGALADALCESRPRSSHPFSRTGTDSSAILEAGTELLQGRHE